MKNIHAIVIGVVLLAVMAVLLPFPAAAAVMADYCQAPPLKSEITPNIMLTIDVSGSMGWQAYSYGDSDTNSDGYRDSGYDASLIYEGYFIPSANYEKDAGGIYTQLSGSIVPCTPGVCRTWSCNRNNTGGTCDARGTHGCDRDRYACCTAWTTVESGNCGVKSGNFLNYALMARVDLFRWAMTGGKPASCGTDAGQGTTGNDCDPEVWANSGNSAKVGAVCNNTLAIDDTGTVKGGCILQLDNKDKVRVPWDRVYAGLTFQFAKMAVKPRMGAMFYEGNGIRADKVYLGDFTGANSKTAYEYFNLITEVNSQDPGGRTPTGPALWDVYNYFAMNPPQYGGFPEQTGTGDRWKNPMYVCANGGTNCTYLPCSDNFVILMSDGEWNQGGDPASVSSTCSIDTGSTRSADPVVPAYLMHKGFTNAANNVASKVRGLYSISLFMDTTNGVRAMQNVALYGSFDMTSKSWPDGRTDYPKTTCGSCKGSLCTGMPTSSLDWDADSDNIPDTYFSGSNATEIKDAIMNAVLDILTHTSAGTAASVLASREGSGANLLQAVYYPKKTFLNGTVDWAGNLQNLWYYIDPAFANSTIREDGRGAGGVHDNVMTLKTGVTDQNDYITTFYFDSGLQSAMASRWTDTNGDASITGETPLPPIKVDTVSNIWEAGEKLWGRAYYNRALYTPNISGTATPNNLLYLVCTPTSCPYSATLAPYMNATDGTGVISSDVASTILQWTHGNDNPKSGTYTPNYRKRLATIGSTSAVWKLGDIINSTPKISTWQPLGDYHITYGKYETTYGPIGGNVYQSDPVNASFYTTGSLYKGRGMVYAGGNDGMLHAFRLGLLQSKWSGQGTFEKAKLTNNVCSVNKNIYCSSDSQCPSPQTCSAVATLGEEAWAFVPKNVLPYLKYMADPNYCHIYTVDMTPTIFDASIGTAGCTLANYYDCYKAAYRWRTVLVGGMRLGGSCREPGSTCTSCVKTPISDPDNMAKGLGYSSYFALDITDQNAPKFMWEYDGTVKNADGTYSNKLGMSYSGPAIVRMSNFAVGGVAGAAQRNGKWLVVFGSGPTGPISSGKSFLGTSDQNLSLHVFDLATGPGVDNSLVTVLEPTLPTGLPIANGFSGSITTTTFDINLDYSDDVLYIPYAYGIVGTNGGLGRLVTNGNINPSAWTWSQVIYNAAPITAAPDMLIDPETKDLWLYFGTGRYFYDSVASTDDANPGKRRQLFGMKEMCLNATKTGFLSSCPSGANFYSLEPFNSASTGGLTNVDDITVANDLEARKASSTDSTYKGWYISLDPALPVGDPILWGERVITNPSVDATGIVYFTTFKPQNDPCYKGGQTNIWAVKYDTGGSAAGLITGTAIIQVSTGSIEQVNLATAFTQKDNRRTVGMTGQPPTREGLTTIPGTPGVSKPLFMKER